MAEFRDLSDHAFIAVHIWLKKQNKRKRIPRHITINPMFSGRYKPNRLGGGISQEGGRRGREVGTYCLIASCCLMLLLAACCSQLDA